MLPLWCPDLVQACFSSLAGGWDNDQPAKSFREPLPRTIPSCQGNEDGILHGRKQEMYWLIPIISVPMTVSIRDRRIERNVGYSQWSLRKVIFPVPNNTPAPSARNLTGDRTALWPLIYPIHETRQSTLIILSLKYPGHCQSASVLHCTDHKNAGCFSSVLFIFLCDLQLYKGFPEWKLLVREKIASISTQFHTQSRSTCRRPLFLTRVWIDLIGSNESLLTCLKLMSKS